jgi:hypothetical protein
MNEWMYIVIVIDFTLFWMIAKKDKRSRTDTSKTAYLIE